MNGLARFEIACPYFWRYGGTASNFQNSDILTQRHFWGTIFKNIIETFRKLIGKNEDTGFAN